MVRAWYMDDEKDTDQRKPHMKDPSAKVTIKDLAEIGVLHWKLDTTDVENNEELKQIRKERGYNYEDCITCSKEKLPNYEEKLKKFFEEHLHSDEEIRLCTEGSGYFDVRDKKDNWIRIELTEGDMIVLPAGIYHRFTLDVNNFIVAKRYFIGEPVWKPYNRPADDEEARKCYAQKFLDAAA